MLRRYVMTLAPFVNTESLQDAEEDYTSAEKVEKWRIGQKAFYQASGPFKVRYLLLREIRKAYPHDFQIKSGCSCAGTFPSRGVVILYGDDQVLKLIPNKERESERILSLLKKRIPDLDTEIPALYQKETREKY